MDAGAGRTSATEIGGHADPRGQEDASQDAVFVKDGAGRYLMVNAEAAALLGRGADELIGHTDLDAFGAAGEVPHQGDLAVMASGEPEGPHEEPVVLAGGARAILRSKTPLRDPQGQVSGLVVVATDMTARNDLAARLEHRETQLLEIEEIAHIGTWEWDVRRDVVRWSRRFQDMLGLRPGDVEETVAGFIGLIHPDDQAEARGALERALAGGEDYAVAHRLVRRDGEVRMMICRGRLVRDVDGEPLRMLGASLDLTEYMGVAEAMRASHEHLLAAESLAGSGSFQYDPESNRVTWSDGMYRLFGVERGEFDGTFEGYMRRVHPADRAKRRAELENLLRNGSPLETTQRIVRGDGSIIRIQSRIEIEPESGRLIGVCWDLPG